MLNRNEIETAMINLINTNESECRSLLRYIKLRSSQKDAWLHRIVGSVLSAKVFKVSEKQLKIILDSICKRQNMYAFVSDFFECYGKIFTFKTSCLNYLIIYKRLFVYNKGFGALDYHLLRGNSNFIDEFFIRFDESVDTERGVVVVKAIRRVDGVKNVLEYERPITTYSDVD